MDEEFQTFTRPAYWAGEVGGICSFANRPQIILKASMKQWIVTCKICSLNSHVHCRLHRRPGPSSATRLLDAEAFLDQGRSLPFPSHRTFLEIETCRDLPSCATRYNYHYAVMLRFVVDYDISLTILPMPAYSAIDPVSGLSSTNWLLAQPDDFHIPVAYEVPPAHNLILRSRHQQDLGSPSK